MVAGRARPREDRRIGLGRGEDDAESGGGLVRLMVINPGASVATIDVHNGYVDALKNQGHEVKVYALDQRIDRAGSWLIHNWNRSGKPDPKPSAADILYWAGMFSIEMALRLEPQWIVVLSGMYLLKDTMYLLRKATYGRAKMALLCTEAPYDDVPQRLVAPLFDVVFVNERTSVPGMRRVNPQTFYLPHAFSPEKHNPDLPIDDDVPAHDVCFVGTGFQERIDLLSAVDWSGIDLGLYGTYTLMGSRSKLRQYVRGEIVSNERAAMLYRRARINLNLYRESMGFGRDAPRIAGASSLNPRAYELAACGAFQLTTPRAEVDEVFRGAVPTLIKPGELDSSCRWFLDHPEERMDLAARALEAVQPHTYAARAEQLTEVLRHVGTIAA